MEENPKAWHLNENYVLSSTFLWYCLLTKILCSTMLFPLLSLWVASEWNPMVNHSNKTTWAVLSHTMYTLCFKWNLGFILSFDSGLLKEPIDRKQTNKQILWTRLIQHTYPCDFVTAQVQSYNVMTAFQTMNRRQIVVSKRSFFQLKQTFTVYCFNLVVL